MSPFIFVWTPPALVLRARSFCRPPPGNASQAQRARTSRGLPFTAIKSLFGDRQALAREGSLADGQRAAARWDG